MSEQTIIALIAALFGGGGLKALEHILNRNKERTDLATQLRDELRGEVNSLKEEVRTIDDDLDHWRKRYYRLLAHYHEVRSACIDGGIQVPRFEEDLRKEEGGGSSN